MGDAAHRPPASSWGGPASQTLRWGVAAPWTPRFILGGSTPQTLREGSGRPIIQFLTQLYLSLFVICFLKSLPMGGSGGGSGLSSSFENTRRIFLLAAKTTPFENRWFWAGYGDVGLSAAGLNFIDPQSAATSRAAPGRCICARLREQAKQHQGPLDRSEDSR